MFEPNINIIFNSKDDVFVFQLETGGIISYTIFDSSLHYMESNSLKDKDILKFSTLIDEYDTIHLVALLNTGDLNYYKFSEKIWSKLTIAKFDTKSNIYNQIEVLKINNKLHIIYNYSNLINSNIWTIQHVVYESEEKHNAIRYLSKKSTDPFVLSYDSQGTIHILYRNDINNPQIYHCFYSPYTRTWSSLPKQVSSDNSNTSLPFLFIDSKDNLHGLWIEALDGRYQLKYLRMSSKGKEKYIWKDVLLPYIQFSKFLPIIFEENNVLKLIFISNNSINLLYSNDYGCTWSKGENSQDIDENIILSKVKKNSNNISYLYCYPFNELKFYFLDSLLHKESKNSTNELPLETENKNISLEIIHTEDTISNELDTKLNELLSNYKNFESQLSKLLANQESLKGKLDEIQKSVDSKKRSILSRLFN
ncbi:hypothetical protein [Tissierella sp.]|uniref:hypothetical protein n=1 Tax=Tissierella sp. TaxID=41274 RepID=UPI0028589761|nr:hypothetical protein [Tissierella sp.]MDR7855987.1 hypothetical protein [Tissierella sp.]